MVVQSNAFMRVKPPRFAGGFTRDSRYYERKAKCRKTYAYPLNCDKFKLNQCSLAALLQKFSDQTCPACLVAGTDAGARVAVKVFVKENVIAPVFIGLKLL